MTAWITEELFDTVTPDGKREPGRIAIGLPYLKEGEGRCEVVIEPLLSGSYEAAGVGTLQALVAALLRVGAAVGSFLEHGGRIVEPGTDDDVAIDAVLGPLMPATPPPSRPT